MGTGLSHGCAHFEERKDGDGRCVIFVFLQLCLSALVHINSQTPYTQYSWIMGRIPISVASRPSGPVPRPTPGRIESRRTEVRETAKHPRLEDRGRGMGEKL